MGCYVSSSSSVISTGTFSNSQWSTGNHGAARLEVTTPEVAEARKFDERLTRSLKEGTFLALTVPTKYYQGATKTLCERMNVQLTDIEAVFLRSLKEIAADAKVDWELVLRTDAKPGEGDWSRLMLLIRRAAPLIEKELLSSEKPVLMVFPGLLARYQQMQILEKVRDTAGRPEGVPAAWLLLPGDNKALINGQPVPLIGPGQKAHVPSSWLRGRHLEGAEVQRDKGAQGEG
jgi:hypothetical protein